MPILSTGDLCLRNLYCSSSKHAALVSFSLLLSNMLCHKYIPYLFAYLCTVAHLRLWLNMQPNNMLRKSAILASAHFIREFATSSTLVHRIRNNLTRNFACSLSMHKRAPLTHVALKFCLSRVLLHLLLPSFHISCYATAENHHHQFHFSGVHRANFTNLPLPTFALPISSYVPVLLRHS